MALPAPPPPPEDDLNRREFLGHNARNAAGVAAGMVSLAPAAVAHSANQRVTLGLIGAGRRGRRLAATLAARSDVDLAVLCDIDPAMAGRAARDVAEAQGFSPDLDNDFRRLLDRSDLDAVVIAVPDHWHASMTIQACQAGKDVYLEAPVSRTIGEARRMVRTAAETGRIVQCGLQQRSGEHFLSAIAFLQGGGLGRVRLARAWTVHRGKTIGFPADSAPPARVDYDRWLGPAPRRDFNANRFHDHWRWFWDYGGGALGHWGVHAIDVARWGLGLELPDRVAASGGTYHFHDARQAPDTLCVQYRYPQATLLWEHRLWSSHGPEGRSTGTAFYGELGSLVIDRGGWKVYDRNDAPHGDGGPLEALHAADFIDCLRTRRTPAADIAIGATSTTLCHLGNLAFRLGRELTLDPHSGLLGDDEANRLAELPAEEAVDRGDEISG